MQMGGHVNHCFQFIGKFFQFIGKFFHHFILMATILYPQVQVSFEINKPWE